MTSNIQQYYCDLKTFSADKLPQYSSQMNEMFANNRLRKKKFLI